MVHRTETTLHQITHTKKRTETAFRFGALLCSFLRRLFRRAQKLLGIFVLGMGK